jgi:hypothetical protein
MPPVFAWGCTLPPTVSLFSSQHSRTSNGGPLSLKFPTPQSAAPPLEATGVVASLSNESPMTSDPTMVQSMCCSAVLFAPASSASHAEHEAYYGDGHSCATPIAEQFMQQPPQPQVWHGRCDLSALPGSHQCAHPVLMGQTRVNTLYGLAPVQHESFQVTMRQAAHSAPLNHGSDTVTGNFQDLGDDSSDSGDLSFECGSLCGDDPS